MRAAKKAFLFCAGALLSTLVVPVGTNAGASTPPLTVEGIRTYPTVSAVQARVPGSGMSLRGAATTAGPAPMTYHAGTDGVGVTAGVPKVYLVFWGAQWGAASPPGSTNFAHDPQHMAPRLEKLFAGIGTNGEGWSDVMTQYCEGVPRGTATCPPLAARIQRPTNGVLAGVWDDIAAPMPKNATSNEIAAEAKKAAVHFGNTTAAANRNAQYVVVSPSGTHPGSFPSAGFCAWHAFSKSDLGDFAYTNLPYIPDAGINCGAGFVNATNGALDGVTMVAGHEYAETITDQFPTQTTGGWWGNGQQENADRCAWIRPGTGGGAGNVAFATGTFAMQGTWSNEADGCVLQRTPRTVHVMSKQGVAMLTDAGGSTIFVLGATTILSSHPYVFDAGSDANCVDKGATSLGYALDCSRDGSLTIDLGDGADFVRGTTNAALTIKSATDPKDVSVGSAGRVQLFGGSGADTLQITHAAPGSAIDGGAGADTINAKDGVAETVSCGSAKGNPAQADGAHDRARVDAGLDTVVRCNALDTVSS